MTRIVGALGRGALLALALACTSVVAAAQPAGAHGLGGIEPTNYESSLVRVAPDVPGITLRLVDLGRTVELDNETPEDVVVLGYDDEPYLRVGPRGVFENRRSPATYINRSATAAGVPPKSADPSAPPRWKQLSTGQTAQWHDHRAHFMGTDDPPIVERNRDHRFVFDHWTITMLHGAETITARGELAWVPPPSPWPFVIAALVVAVGFFAACRTRWWKQLIAGGLAVIVITEAVHVAGLWGASTESAGTKLVQSAYSLGGIALGVLALIWMARRGAHAAMPLVLVASIVLVVAGGLSDVTTLGRSLLPTTLPYSLARVLVTVTLGVGVGLAAAAGMRLRDTTPRRPARRAAPAARTPEVSATS
jgi:hypothetical protein